MKQASIFFLLVGAMAAAIGTLFTMNNEAGGKIIMLSGIAGLWIGIILLVAGVLQERKRHQQNQH
jgi:hypothetical protein